MNAPAHNLPATTEIQVAAGTDYAQLEALLHLSQLWAMEEYGNELDVALWSRTMASNVGSGMWCPVVAWCGDEAVGMMEVFFRDDPGALIRMGHGDRAFVKEEWRASGAFRALYEAAHGIGHIMGANETCLPVGAEDEAGKFLKPMYEREGYRVTGYIMRRAL